MKAAISFTILEDFTPYLKNVYFSDEEAEFYNINSDYKKALEVLNDKVQCLVETGNLKINYKSKPVKILLPIKEENCGNIFGDNDYI